MKGRGGGERGKGWKETERREKELRTVGKKREREEGRGPLPFFHLEKKQRN